MTSHRPPVPPEQQSRKGPHTPPHHPEQANQVRPDDRDRNLAEQGRQGNLKQNTTNKGLQQDR